MKLNHLYENVMTLEQAQDWCDENCEKRVDLLATDKPGVFNVEKSFITNKNISSIPFKLEKVGNFNIAETNITTLENCPSICGGYYIINRCYNLKSLIGLPKEIGSSSSGGVFGAVHLKIPLLRLLLVRGISQFALAPSGLSRIFNKHYKEGDRSAIVPCQDELIEYGFEWAAKL